MTEPLSLIQTHPYENKNIYKEFVTHSKATPTPHTSLNPSRLKVRSYRAPSTVAHVSSLPYMQMIPWPLSIASRRVALFHAPRPFCTHVPVGKGQLHIHPLAPKRDREAIPNTEVSKKRFGRTFHFSGITIWP